MQRWIRNWLHKAQCIVNDGSLWGAAHCCEFSLIECCRLKEIHGLSKEVSGIPIWDLLVYASRWRSRMLVLNLRKQSFQSEDGDFGLCQVAAAAGIFLVLETPSAEVECCSICLVKDLEAGCGGLCSWWGSSVHSLDKHSPFVEASKHLLGRLHVPPSHTLFTRMIREYVHSVHTVKQKARSWQIHILLGSFSEGIFGNLRDLWIVADYQPCSPAQANAPLNFIFFFEDSRVVFWWPHNILYGWRK